MLCQVLCSCLHFRYCISCTVRYIYCCHSIMQHVRFIAAKYNAVCSIIAAEYSAVRVKIFAAE